MGQSQEVCIFAKLSTTTNIASFPPNLGRPSTKSIEISSQIAFGIGGGYNNPAGEERSGLFL